VTPIGTFEEALYFLIVTFTTVGYGDITLGAEEWRLLSGTEALNGVLLARVVDGIALCRGCSQLESLQLSICYGGAPWRCGRRGHEHVPYDNRAEVSLTSCGRDPCRCGYRSRNWRGLAHDYDNDNESRLLV
jgi:hypothetical protein